MFRWTFTLTILAALAPHASAAVVFDADGFEAYNTGALLPQFGWQDFNAPNGNRFTIQDAVTNGGNRAVSASASNAIAGFVAPAVNFTPAAGEAVVIEVDIARTRSQFPFQASSNGFNVDVYNPGADRIMGFGLAINAANDGVEAFVTRGDGTMFGTSDLINLTVSEAGGRTEFISFRAELNFDTDTFVLTTTGSNGTVSTPSLAFVNASATLGDADLQHDSVVNAQDVGYFDNYRINTVPEPNSAVACLLAMAGLMIRRRRS